MAKNKLWSGKTFIRGIKVWVASLVASVLAMIPTGALAMVFIAKGMLALAGLVYIAGIAFSILLLGYFVKAFWNMN